MEIGNYNELYVSRIVENGAYLADEQGNEVFFPGNYFPPTDLVIDQKMRVFVYCDSKDRPVATTETPKAIVNQFAVLKVKDVCNIGAFLDWGITKDLFVPHGQMIGAMRVGQEVIVRVLFDDRSKRMVATPRLRPFLKKPKPEDFFHARKVECLIYEIKDNCVHLITEGDCSAMIYLSEFRKPPQLGEKVVAFVREFTPEGKLTLTLAPMGMTRVLFRDAIYDKLVSVGGFLPINDSSSSDEIAETFGVSKRTFKKLAGNLMKAGKMKMNAEGIWQVK